MSEEPIILNGKYLRDQKEKVLAELVTSNDFNLMFKELQNDVSMNEQNLKVVRAYIFDYEGPAGLGTGKHFTVQYQNKVQISYLFAAEGNEIYEQVYGRLVTPDQKSIKVYESNKGEVVLISTDAYEGQLEIELMENGKHDENFRPSSSERLVKPAAFKTGCLYDSGRKKYYKHCGSGCGDCKSCTEGGGTPINKIDTCCRTHDRCWTNFGSWDHCCDKNLVNCANKYESEDNATQNKIWLAFKASAILC